MTRISAVSTHAAVEPGDRADRDADGDRDQHRGDPDRERDAPAIEHAREHVLPEVVGAEGMLPRWPLSLALKSISLIGTRQTSGPKTHREDERQAGSRADHGQAMPAEPSPRLVPQEVRGCGRGDRELGEDGVRGDASHQRYEMRGSSHA